MNKGKEDCLKKCWHKAVMVLMALVLVVFIVPMTVSAGEVISGTYEDAENISWTYDEETKTLILTGDSGENAKWDKLKNIANGEFKHIVVKDCTLRGSLVDMFYDMEEVESIRFLNVDTSNVTNMGGMFLLCSSLKVLDINCLNTSNVTNMAAMFSGCSSLETLDVSSLQTENVTNMTGMFRDCSSLKEIDVSGFNTSKVTQMLSIFEGCSNLTELDLSNLDMSRVVVEWQMFDGCNYLQKLHTPKILKEDFWMQLPHAFYTSNGEEVIVLTPKYQNTLLTIGKNPFADVKVTSWQYKAAKYVYDKGLMTGKGTDTNGNVIFDPNKPIPREEFVQVLYNAKGKPAVTIENQFPDVKNAWYKNAVLWACENNIAKGKGNGDFGVTESISRQDLALMLYKYANLKGYDLSVNVGEINKYADGDKISSYAKTAMDWAISNGIMSGKGTKGEPNSTFKLDPTGTATRAECATMLMNFMEAYKFATRGDV